MTGSELKTQFEGWLDGETMDATLFYQITNIARSNIEAIRSWEILKSEQSSETTSSSDTFETYHSLPSDFAYDYKMFVGESGLEPEEYYPIQFEQKRMYQNSHGYYYIDLANDRYALTGKQLDSRTIYLFYIKDSTEISSGTSWVFPARFHDIIAIETAKFAAQIPEYDDLNKVIAERGLLPLAETIKQAMVLWDQNLRLRAMNHTTQNTELREYIDGHVNTNEYQ